ncbi:hypothetical protein VTN00DRAFT_9157 [Thermoascus crustaceus]|uniref:uncharacterized protein n=1 Tax=Thermoascus crustaceus TaxID=5088 RepID=UPI0037422921
MVYFWSRTAPWITEDARTYNEARGRSETGSREGYDLGSAQAPSSGKASASPETKANRARSALAWSPLATASPRLSADSTAIMVPRSRSRTPSTVLPLAKIRGD